MALPVLPPAEQDLEILITIPAVMVPYFNLIHQEVAPGMTQEEYLSDFTTRKGKEYLQQREAKEAAAALVESILGTQTALEALENM